MGVFLSYIILGLSISAPLGPINAAQIDKGIKNGFLHAWLIGLGAMIADISYMVLVFLGVVHLVNQPFVKTFLWLFGAFVLTYTGVESLLKAKEVQINEERSIASFGKTLLTGFLMSASSPLSILFWLGIFGSVLAQTAAVADHSQLIYYSSGIIAGIMIWDFTMAGIAGIFRKYVNRGFLTGISVVSGFSLIGFGGYFGIQGLQMLLA
ncbi:LysE family transporter [Cohnella candidum]|uniref:Amino acid transporter n=1 Tax=Cohnella candidum TaxID=2674991 RepID=A0A3G3JTM9_9BACL|nr:LysE family transporter [Cohnella candidum]AYQ71578.1 amino acid transporter [Cohnella candidum]